MSWQPGDDQAWGERDDALLDAAHEPHYRACAICGHPAGATLCLECEREVRDVQRTREEGG